MKNKKILKSISYKKIYLKPLNSPKNLSLPLLTNSYTTRNTKRKYLSPQKNNPLIIENQISSTTKKLEISKINLGILRDRLTQKKITLKNLEIKPKKVQKKTMNQNYLKNNERMKGRERELIEAFIKLKKDKTKAEYDFKNYTDNIDVLIEDNKKLKNEINRKRKKKIELEKIKEKILQDIINKKNKLSEILKINNKINIEEKTNELNQEIKNDIEQKKMFEMAENYFEQEYNRVIKEYILKERENANELNFNRKIAELRNKGNIKNLNVTDNNKKFEVQKELKKLEDDVLGDRTPILDECLEKWRIVNKEKKDNINKYIKNCKKIKKIFEKLTLHLDLDSFLKLPEVFRKTEYRESNINLKLEAIENENIELEKEKKNLIEEIELIKCKKAGNEAYKKKFYEQKNNNIKSIDNVIKRFEKDIIKKQKFFGIIQPETDKFLKKLDETYLSEFVYDKIPIKEDIKYNYLTVNKYLSNVEDYFNLVQEWKENNNTENFNIIENQNFNKLNENMKESLENFEKYKLINKSVANSMHKDIKNGFNLSEIIKKTSRKIIIQANYNDNNKSKLFYSKYNKSRFGSTDNSDDENIKYGCETQAFQQSSVIIPNSTRKND